jgi:hypothetical protein
MASMMKGGVWKNSEDEILKAAVMKYGMNNWPRIASLLVRKTPLQCKARWHEWLDPSVKKTEWSRDEDEKLLHLVKIFPTQWRTIAPIVGRTAHQCQERYEKLLDETQGRETMDESDPRILRPGEVDPIPETRPAKADPVDMDDDEKQMLQEARARLANVHGKKAKRKAREKVMEETRRLAQLQKDRELRAAGLSAGPRRLKRGEMDYNKEIPFETLPQIGVHAFGSEEDPRPKLSLQNLTLHQLEGKARKEEDKKLEKDEKRQIKKIKETKMPQDFVAEQNASFRKINELSLPAVEDSEDEDMLGYSIHEPLKSERFNARNILMQLPAVENEVEIDSPEIPDEEPEEVMIPDRGETSEISGMPVEELRWKSSSVVSRGLPRPVMHPYTGDSAVGRMLYDEMVALSAADAIDHPVLGMRPIPGVKAANRSTFTLDELKEASALIAGSTSEGPPAAEIRVSFPELTQAKGNKLEKSILIREAHLSEMRKTAKESLGSHESEMLRLDDRLTTQGSKLEDIKRHVRVMQICAAAESSHFDSHLEGLREKLKIEKSRNKSLQDKYLRLCTFIKQMSR